MVQDIKIFITGANGFIGSTLAKHLADKGYHPTAIVRKKKWEHKNIRFIEGDLFEIKNILSQKEKFDAVIHLAADLKTHEKNGRLYRNNFLLTKELIDFFPKKTHFIFFSTIEACGPTGEKYVSEDDIPLPVSDYGKIKLETERLVNKSCKKFTILRIGNAYNNYKGVSKEIESMLLKKDLFSIIQAFFLKYVIHDYEVNPIGIKDICRTIEAVLGSRHSNTYFVVSKPCSVLEVISGKKIKTANLSILFPLVFLFNKLLSQFKISSLVSYLTEGGIKRKYRRYSSEKLKKDFNLSFK